MNYRKSLISALILGLSIVLLAGPASAWEFSTDGIYTWQYDTEVSLDLRGFLEPMTRQPLLALLRLLISKERLLPIISILVVTIMGRSLLLLKPIPAVQLLGELHMGAKRIPLVEANK